VSGPIHHQANLVLRFVLEMCALAALCYWGFRTGDGPLVGPVLGVGAPLLGAVVWGLFASPRARVYLPLAGRLAVELVFFGSASAGLYATGHSVLGTTLVVVAASNRVLIQAWRQDERMRTNA
jgi:hypothetical protein